ncbi:hypothetical protein [Arthrobacter sp. B2a2-09]|uniref:hypothetical protein n=1 Tax=Arthrobacter sp. B2a2-09 TaxID=2952822 RepID=UPI0022CD2E85|nr:hypothetical protein [Arthrobacter sp. B2a2-09]MCZ9884102.1 hypothetical protein [Arthrobacter sp. B2a2-09]
MPAEFEVKRGAYEVARSWLLFLIDHPDKTVSAREYSAQLKAAQAARDAAHTAMVAAW